MSELHDEIISRLIVHERHVGGDALVLPVPDVDGAVQPVVADVLDVGVEHYCVEGAVTRYVSHGVVEYLVPTFPRVTPQCTVILLGDDLGLLLDVLGGGQAVILGGLHLLGEYPHDLVV